MKNACKVFLLMLGMLISFILILPSSIAYAAEEVNVDLTLQKTADSVKAG